MVELALGTDEWFDDGESVGFVLGNFEGMELGAKLGENDGDIDGK